MMWTKTGADMWKATNGSGFEANVRDMGDHFIVSTPGHGVMTMKVDANSLDALKLAVTEMELAVAS